MKTKNLLQVFAISLLAFVLPGCDQSQPAVQVKVSDYMPEHAVIAHRGTIYWAPELTEAAFRWARNTGSDYVELDVHRSKDGVLIIMHDRTFKRTTDVAEKFPGREDEPIDNFTYAEIMTLDAGSPFNIKRPGQALESYVGQDVLVFEDVFRIAEGKRIKRDSEGKRVVTVDDSGKYHFEYEDDPADNHHRPGVYIEVKAPDKYPGIEEQIYELLTQMNWNPLEGMIPDLREPFWKGDRVNVGNTRGKILVQTFSQEGMMNVKRVFQEKVLASFLIGNPRSNEFAKEEVTDSLIAFALKCGAQFIGTNLGEANDGLSPQFAAKIHHSGILTNVYSFDTVEQMEKYFDVMKDGVVSPLADGMITNRADLTVDFYYSRGVRKQGQEKSPQEVLTDLGYIN